MGGLVCAAGLLYNRRSRYGRREVRKMIQHETVEGIWEEIVSHRAAQLAGRRVKITIEPEKNDASYSLDTAIAKLNSRTEEEIETARKRILAATKKPLPLPTGKPLADVIMGQWPGDETDAEINEALRKLS